MHKFSASFLMFLCYFNLILSIKVENIDYKSSLKQTQNQLTQMLMEVESSETPLSIDDVEKSITKILNEVQDSQDRHVAISKRMHSQCVDEAKFRQSEIRDANEAFKASGDALAKCQISLESATKYLPQLQKAQLDYRAILKQKSDEREKNHKIFIALQQDWSNAITFLIDFNREITKANGAPTTTGFSQMTENLIRHMTKVGKLKELAPIFAQITAKGNDNLVKLSNLVVELKNQLAADQKVAQTEEKKQVQIFNTLKTNLNKILDQLKANISRTNAQIISMRLCVAKEKTIMFAAASKSSRNSRLLTLADKTCKDFAREFIQATNTRNSELVMIKQIIGIIHKRFGKVDADILKRLRTVSVTLKAYINGTEFHSYKEYVKTRIADNFQGRILSGNFRR